MPEFLKRHNTGTHNKPFVRDFETFQTFDDALGELPAERPKSALLIAELDNQRIFFRDQPADLQRNLKNDRELWPSDDAGQQHALA